MRFLIVLFFLINVFGFSQGIPNKITKNIPKSFILQEKVDGLPYTWSNDETQQLFSIIQTDVCFSNEQIKSALNNNTQNTNVIQFNDGEVLSPLNNGDNFPYSFSVQTTNNGSATAGQIITIFCRDGITYFLIISTSLSSNILDLSGSIPEKLNQSLQESNKLFYQYIIEFLTEE